MSNVALGLGIMAGIAGVIGWMVVRGLRTKPSTGNGGGDPGGGAGGWDGADGGGDGGGGGD